MQVSAHHSRSVVLRHCKIVTICFQAASFGHSEAATTLIQLGCDGMLKDVSQRSVMHRVKDGACCDIIASKFPKLIDQVDLDYLSPLHLAAGEGNAAVVKVLLMKGADPTGTGECIIYFILLVAMLKRGAGGYEETVVEVDPPPISQLSAAEARARR